MITSTFNSSYQCCQMQFTTQHNFQQISSTDTPTIFAEPTGNVIPRMCV